MVMKIIRHELTSSPRELARFVDEAQVTAQLEHPGIVSVHELGRLADGRAYFTTKEVRGRTFAFVDLASNIQGRDDCANADHDRLVPETIVRSASEHVAQISAAAVAANRTTPLAAWTVRNRARGFASRIAKRRAGGHAPGGSLDGPGSPSRALKRARVTPARLCGRRQRRDSWD